MILILQRMLWKDGTILEKGESGLIHVPFHFYKLC